MCRCARSNVCSYSHECNHEKRTVQHTIATRDSTRLAGMRVRMQYTRTRSFHFSRSYGHAICRFLSVTHTHVPIYLSPFAYVCLTTSLFLAFSIRSFFLGLKRARSRTLYRSSLALETDRRPKATILSCGRTLIVECEVKCGAPLPGVLVVGAKPTV